MTTLEMKEKMHRQIDILTEAEDISDLFETMSFFFNHRDISIDTNSPIIIEKLKNSLENIHRQEGITTEELKVKMQEWLTK